jgi:hypothetical protein
MKQEKFIKVLNKEGYSYEIEGDNIVVGDEEWHVDLSALTSIPPGVEFRNGGTVNMGSLASISPGVEFNNGESVYLRSLVGGWFEDWSGNIEGIEPTSLLNVMIKQGMFI